MARDSSGTYTRISNSFSEPVAQTVISPTDAEAFFDELDTEITDSLSRSGKGGMSASAVLKIADGTSAAPALTFNTDTDTGLARTTANTMVAVASGVAVITVQATMATIPNATISNAQISGGAVTGITDIAVADGGTAASTAASARANLGLAIGSDVQAFSARLTDIATITYAQGDILYHNGSNIVKLAAGSSGNFLKTQGAAANPVWEALPSGGDMLAANNLSDVADATTARENISAALKGHVYGLSTANNGTDSDHDIDIAVGEAASDDTSDPVLMRLTSAITKRIDATWAVGSGNGGLDTGAVANTTWYYLWLIMRSDTGVVDVLFSTSSSSPTMPADYDHKRLIWAVKTNSSANIEAYTQVGDLSIWPTTFTEVSAVTVTSATTYTIASVPPLLGVKAELNVFLNNASAAGAAKVFSALLTDARYNIANGASGNFGACDMTVPVNGSGQIKAYNSVSSNALSIYGRGFRFPF